MKILSYLTPVFGVDAWIKLPSDPVIIPTWSIPPPPNEKNTRSPGLRLFVSTAYPLLNWAAELCGRLTPTCLYAYDVRPEQSNPTLGSDAPHT